MASRRSISCGGPWRTGCRPRSCAARSAASTSRWRAGWPAACAISSTTSWRRHDSGVRDCSIRGGRAPGAGAYAAAGRPQPRPVDPPGPHGVARRSVRRCPTPGERGCGRQSRSLTGTENSHVTALEALKEPTPDVRGPLRAAADRPERAWGRWWQVVVAAGGLLVLSPVSFVIAMITKLMSRGPILYRGTRIGRGLEPFTIYKFRTLLVDAEQRIGARLLTPGDDLYTPIGRFMKRYKLDEIPQLLNVIKGDMNLVGPRPIRPIFLATSTRDIPNYTARFAVRPGMTGLAQLRGGYFTHPRDKLRYDVLYIHHRSVWLDVKLVVATFVKLLNRWLTLGFFLGLLFLSASFLPTIFRAPFELRVAGFRLSPVELIGLLLTAAMLVRQVPSHRLYVYRTPTNLPMACFVLCCILAGLVAGDLSERLRDAAYFTASGFLLFFLIVSGEITEDFATRATRVGALAAVAVALLGILEIAVQTHVVVASNALAQADLSHRITGTLGSPVVLAAYLVLGMPLVMVELVCAERREERDFWLICSTLVVIGILLTQTRTGFIALWLTGSVFCWRVSRRTFRLFAGVSLAFVIAMGIVGGLRLSPDDLRT